MIIRLRTEFNYIIGNAIGNAFCNQRTAQYNIADVQGTASRDIWDRFVHVLLRTVYDYTSRLGGDSFSAGIL
jgi:hypothetical protein